MVKHSLILRNAWRRVMKGNAYRRAVVGDVRRRGRVVGFRKWRKNPRRFDLRGLDDGSRRAKFSKMGTRRVGKRRIATWRFRLMRK